MAAGDLMMDGELDDGRRSLNSSAAAACLTSTAMDEHARLLGFSTRQGEQEVHGVGLSISGWRHALAPGWPAPSPGCSRGEKEDLRREPLGTLYRQGLGYGEQQAARRAPLQFCCNPSE